MTLLTSVRRSCWSAPHNTTFTIATDQHVYACRTAYFISSHEGPLPKQGFAELLDCGLLTQAPSLQSLEQVRTALRSIWNPFSCKPEKSAGRISCMRLSRL